MNPVFGIHVGNSRACVAMCKWNESKFLVEVIANSSGERVMPTFVTVTENEWVVGTPCKSLMISQWATTVTSNKRLLNRDLPDSDAGSRSVKTVIHDNEICYVLPLEDKTEEVTPTDIARCIFATLYEIAQSALPSEGDEASCVLMVPKYFSEEATLRIRRAAEAVSWNVLHIISEPAASVLGYNLFPGKTPPSREKLLIYRVGGRSCDTALINIEHGLMTVLDTEYTEEVGGDRLVTTLTHHLANEFYRRYKLDPKESHRSITKLTLAAEKCLQVLSTIESTSCFVESLYEGVDFSHTMTRARFESLLNPMLIEFAKPIYTLLSRCNMTADKVSKVLLSGGPLKIPRLKNYISDIFQNSFTEVVPLPSGINYDEVLACGAAYQAGYLAADKMGDNFLPSQIDIPVLQYPLNIMVEGATYEELELESGLPLPVHRILRLAAPQETVTLTFTQQENEEVTLRGLIELKGLSDPVELQLKVDSEDGIKIGVPGDPGGDTLHHIVTMNMRSIISNP